MNSMPTKQPKQNFLIAILFMQLTLYVTIFFDIPIARQILGFIYFTFMPGFIIIKLLKLNEFDLVETVLFSTGLSIAFLMIIGLLINEFGLILGVLHPLSLMPLIITFNSLVLVGVALIYLRSENIKLFGNGSLPNPTALLLLCLPILSIAGAMCVNAHGNNMTLLFTIIAISSLFTIGVLSRKFLPSKLYPLAVFLIAIAVLYHSSLISNYIVPFGSDVPIEYFAFRTTEENALWGSYSNIHWGPQYGRVYTMLSVTILPTIYSNLLNIDPTWMFKLFFPMILALVPLGLYQVWQTYVNKRYAFIAAFLLMAQFAFFTEILGLNRQIIAELFFVLLLLVILNKKIKAASKMIFFMIFSFALVTSHYGLAEIFLFFIFSALIFQIVLKRPSKRITVSMVVFFFVIMFAWYIFTSGAAVFESFLEFGDHVYRQLGDFFDPTSRGRDVLTGLGMTQSPSIWNTISRVFAYLTQALIVLGFIALVIRRTRFSFEKEFVSFSSIAMILLAALILVPGLANTMNMTRFYHVLLFFLAPLCVLGAEFISRLVFKHRYELAASVLLLLILVPYFLFQTSFIYEVTRSDSWSIPLSKYRMSASRLYGHYAYTDEYSVRGAEWVSQNIDVKNATLYSDVSSPANVLTIYGMIYDPYVNRLSNTTLVADNGVIYLSTLNVIEDVLPFWQLSWNSSELSFIFDDLDLVYTNGGSEIYRNPA